MEDKMINHCLITTKIPFNSIKTKTSNLSKIIKVLGYYCDLRKIETSKNKTVLLLSTCIKKQVRFFYQNIRWIRFVSSGFPEFVQTGSPDDQRRIDL
jgi:hypothetical protein